MREGVDFGRDTRASVWYKRTRPFPGPRPGRRDTARSTSAQVAVTGPLMRTFPGEIRTAPGRFAGGGGGGGAGFRESGRRRGAAWSSAPAPSATPTVGDTSTRGPPRLDRRPGPRRRGQTRPVRDDCRPLPTGAGHPGASRPADSLADVIDRRDRAHPRAPSPGARPWCRGRSCRGGVPG